MNERPKIRKNREFTKFKIMSETKKMTTEEILEIFKGEYSSVLRRCEREAEKHTLKMNEDFEYFFRWYAGEMYVATVNLKAVRELRPATYWDDPVKIKTWLIHQIESIENMLIEGSQTPASTSLMMNAADTLQRVAKQRLRIDLQRLLSAITDNE